MTDRFTNRLLTGQILLISCTLLLTALLAGPIWGQRNFVTAVTPVIGPNGSVVGGILIDAGGVVSRADTDESGRMSRERAAALVPFSEQMREASALRKISLARLEKELIKTLQSKSPLSSEMEFLAGLQRIEYIFLNPEEQDIILAGPADDFRIDRHGYAVGQQSGLPVLELCDLIAALRINRSQAIDGISCSMDATKDGLRNYAAYSRRSNREFNEQTLQEMKDAIGNFEVTFTGVDGESHFARILIAADIMMKRLGMHLEPSPVKGVTSYVQMMQESRQRMSRSVSPRWWLATDYRPLLRDTDGLAWKIQGRGVKAMTENDFISQSGSSFATGRTNYLAQQWADDFSRHFEKLSVELPVFGQLRNCMDWIVLAALLHKHDLLRLSRFESTILTNADRIKTNTYPVAKFTEPQISYAKNRRGWIVTLSGGVDIDGWSVAENVKTDRSLETIRSKAFSQQDEHWWWD